ncbi:periplasmic binding protein-like I [Paraphysoderma sedebokerense]|nr:periplasmic binding protein-like I [Paraphysoderma sedebokerense]
MWSRLLYQFCLFTILIYQTHGQLVNYTLGFIYPNLTLQTWATDSLRAFNLAVTEINGNTSYNGSFKLSYVFKDEGEGNETLAALGVYEISTMPNVTTVGYIGTGYSRAVEGPAVLSSALQKPIISPGSTSAQLTEKTYMPYLMRSISSSLEETKFVAEFVAATGFKNVALLVDDKGLGTYPLQVFRQIAQANGINIRTFLYIGDETNYDFVFLTLRDSGVKVIVNLAIPSTWRKVGPYAQKYDMAGNGYTWITVDSFESGHDIDLMLYNWTGLMNSRRATSGANDAGAAAFNTKWQNLYNATVSQYALYAYDTVYLFAEAIRSLLGKAGNPQNGSQLLSELKSLQHLGITGLIKFDPVTQDRVEYFNMLNVRNGTAQLVQYTTGQTQLNDSDILWAEGLKIKPTDGSVASSQASFVVNRSNPFVGVASSFQVVLRNNFYEPVNITSSEISIAVSKNDIPLSSQPTIQINNGTVNVTFSYPDPGLYSLRILLHGRDIAGSPFSVQALRVPTAPEYISQAGTPGVIITLLLIILYVLVGLTAAMLFKYRHAKPIRALSVGFCLLILSGVLIMGSSLWSFIGMPTATSCVAQIWTLAVGFGLTWGCLLAKTYRIYKIFNNARLQKLHASRSFVMLAVAVTLLEVMFALIWTLVDAPKPSIVMLPDDAGSYWTCSSGISAPMLSVLCCYNAILILASVFLCTQIRQIKIQAYNESLTIGSTVYLITVACAVILPISSIPTLGVSTRFLLLGLLILFGGYAFVTILFWNRIYLVIRYGMDGESKTGKTTSPLTTTPATNNGSANKPSAQIKSLDAKIVRYFVMVQEQKLMSRWEQADMTIISDLSRCYISSQDSPNSYHFNMKECKFSSQESSSASEDGTKLSEIVIQLPDKRKIRVQPMNAEVDLEQVFGQKPGVGKGQENMVKTAPVLQSRFD